MALSSSQRTACLLFAMIGVCSAVMQKETQQPAHVDQEKPIEDYNWAQHAPVRGNRTRPRMLVSQGCDNYEEVIDHARILMKLHGIHTPWRGAHPVQDADPTLKESTGAENISHSNISLGELDEIFVSSNESEQWTESADEEPNEVDADEDAGEMERNDSASSEAQESMVSDIVDMHDVFAAQGKAVLFKGTIGKDNTAIFSKALLRMGTLAVVVSRRNKVDQLVCMVKDCVNETFGYPMSQGVKSDICWKRHQQDTPDYKAFLEPAQLAPAMTHLEAKVELMRKQLKKNGYWKVIRLDTEDLLDFTWDKEAIGRGVKAWTHLLQAWGVGAMPLVISKYIQQKAGTRPGPSPHTESIVDYDDVKHALENKSHFMWMLRE